MNFIPHHHIPKEAKKVFTWIRSEVFQWDQKMYDGSIATFERIRFLDGAFVIAIDTDGMILLTRQIQPGRPAFISLPGGSFDFGEEDPLVCAQRELIEETGYVSTEWKEWMRFDGTSNVMTYAHFFIARECRKIQEISPDPGEQIELFSLDFDAFLELSSDKRFHHHWNLLPYLYEARLDTKKKEDFRKLLFES